LIDNSWRNTRFSFANELAYLAEEKHIDVMEAVEAANKEYDRNAIPRPGPVSGYCLGKDPYLLEIAFKSVANRRGFNSVWYYGRLANDWMINKIITEVQGKNVLVVGLSFKENIDDFRYSHSIEIIRNLVKKHYNVIVCDPFLNKNYYTELPLDIKDKIKSYNNFEKALENKLDTIIFSTRHTDYQNLDLNKIIDKQNIQEKIKVIDLWNILRVANHPKVEYKALGKGS
jgi:nucleotide sugar dehydrogenase